MKHQDMGDESTTRSGLFIEAIRIIKEMRCATNGLYPRISLWENVPGAFSSNKGRDFCAVLEETLKEASGQSTTIPMPPKGKWLTAGCIMGDNYSIAWRVVDAQYYGVPQRRRRIILVTDFRGLTAPQILFEPESMCRDTQEGGEQGEVTSGSSGKSTAVANLKSDSLDVEKLFCKSAEIDLSTPKTLLIRGGMEGGGKGALIQENKSATLSCVNSQTLFEPIRSTVKDSPEVFSFLRSDQYKHSNVTCTQSRRQFKGPTDLIVNRFAVRRLTPTECERLQGFPDGWTAIDKANESERYKALGNSIAVKSFYPYIERISNIIKISEGEMDE